MRTRRKTRRNLSLDSGKCDKPMKRSKELQAGHAKAIATTVSASSSRQQRESGRI